MKMCNCRTFRLPSNATLAPYGDRPILTRFEARVVDDQLDVSPAGSIASRYEGVELADGRIILTPGEDQPLEEPDLERAEESGTSEAELADHSPTTPLGEGIAGPELLASAAPAEPAPQTTEVPARQADRPPARGSAARRRVPKKE